MALQYPYKNFYEMAVANAASFPNKTVVFIKINLRQKYALIPHHEALNYKDLNIAIRSIILIPGRL